MARTNARYFMEWLDWITAAVLNADHDYDGLDCRTFTSVELEFLLASAGAPDGQLFIEWSMGDGTWYPFDFTNEKYNEFDPGGKFTVSAALGQVDVLALAADSSFALIVKEPPPWLRWRWKADSGGSATGASSKAFGRHYPA